MQYRIYFIIDPLLVNRLDCSSQNISQSASKYMCTFPKDNVNKSCQVLCVEKLHFFVA